MIQLTATPIDSPFADPLALSPVAKLSLLRDLSGRLATTAYFSPPAKTAVRPAHSPQRVRQAHAEWVEDRLSNRDRAIIASVHRLRVARGPQLERLHFAELSEDSRARSRRRVLRRLSDWRVLTPLERRIGGARTGSDGLVFALDSTGQLLVRDLPVRRPYTPDLKYLKHALAVTELYVELVEQTHASVCELLTFEREPDCWWPDGLGGFKKPDAYLRLGTPDYIDAWWLEQDMHCPGGRSEDLPTIRRKFLGYLDFLARGNVGPHGGIPRVLVSVQTAEREAAVWRIIASLPSPASTLFHVATADVAAAYLLRKLGE